MNDLSLNNLEAQGLVESNGIDSVEMDGQDLIVNGIWFHYRDNQQLDEDFAVLYSIIHSD